MKLHKRILSLALTLSTLVLCFTIFSVMASDIDVSNYTYVVDNMTFYQGDNQIDSLNGATEVAVDVTRQVAGGDRDRLIISTYSDTGEYIGMYSVTHNIDFGKTSNVRVFLNVPEGKTVGEIRAYMWKSFSDMTPLSNVLSSSSPIKIKNVELDAALLYTTGCTTSALEFYNDESENQTTKYKLTADAGVYVNGFKASGTLADALSTYVTSLRKGKITLVSTYGASDEYDKIYVDAYARDMIVAVSGDEIIIKTGVLDLDKEANEDLEYHIYYNGEEISIAELEKDDVLSIAYDINSDIDSSDYYEIYVSRDTVTGTLTKKPDMAATIDGTDYEFLTEAEYNVFANSIALGDKVTLYLDHLGNIYDWKLDLSSINWGIAEKFNLASSDDEYKLTIFTDEGTTKAYYFDSRNGVVKVDGVYQHQYGRPEESLRELVYLSGSTKSPIEDRVIQYKVSSASGKIVDVNFITAEAGNGDTATAFDAVRSKIGAIRLSESTKIIDACEYYEGVLSTNTVDSLVDDASYVAYAYGDKIDNAYPFVLITQGPPPYTANTRFAVVTDSAIPVLLDGEKGFYEIEVLYGENDVTTLIATDEDETDLVYLSAGDVIFFKTNSSGCVEDIDVIFHFDDGIPTYADLASMSLVDNNKDNNVDGITITSAGSNFGTGVFTQDWDATATDTVKLVYGPIAEVTENYISFAKIVNGETDIFTDVQEYDIAPEINVYKYNYGSKARFKFSAVTNTTGASIVAPAYITRLIQDNDNVIDWADATAKHYEKANFAFALVVEDEVVEIFEFIAG